MTKKSIWASEWLFQAIALLVSATLVHSIYTVWIRPQAQTFLKNQEQAMAAGDFSAAETQSIFVMIKDYEQEACFVLLGWALAMMFYKFRHANREKSMLDRGLLEMKSGERIKPDNTIDYARTVENLPLQEQDCLLPRCLRTGLSRFRATRNVQDVSTSVRELCGSEAERLESELSMIRYIAWAIPSVGFIGTVRGIGVALGRAHEAVEGEIAGVTQSLGVAFNSTLIALFISIVLMFIVHQLQLLQERYVMEVERFCDEHLVGNMHQGGA